MSHAAGRVLLLVLGAWTMEARADWPQWRGPTGTGAASAAPTVATFSVEQAVNLRWVTPMPGPSATTPIVVAGHVFLTAYDRDSGMLRAMALDAADGSVRWSHEVARGRDAGGRRGTENYLAECSPAADAERVVFLFGTGDLICYDHAGQPQWRLNLVESYGPMSILFGYAASPLLHDGRVYVSVLRRNDDSYLLCVDAETGDVLWRQPRPSSARDESREEYTTPMVMTFDGRTDIVVYGGDALTGHDPHTGRERWRYEDLLNPRRQGNFRVISGPTQGDDGTIYVATPRGQTLLALTVRDDQPAVKWSLDRAGSDVPCPAYHDGAVFLLAGRNRVIAKLDADTGRVIWRQRLDSASYHRASPIVADGKVYLISAEGELHVLSAADEFEELARLDLGGYPARATIAAAGDALYIRTADRLICAAEE